MKRNHIVRILLTLAFVSGFGAGLAAAKPVAASRLSGPTLISKCQTITASGSYVLTKSFGIAGNCMIIRASNVLLDLKGFGLVGAKVGHAVIIAKGVTNVQVVNGQISAWNFGVQDLGTNTQLVNLMVFNNKFIGVVLAGAAGSTIMNSKFPGNGLEGIQVTGSAGVTVSGNGIAQNKKFGVWVAKSPRFTLKNNLIKRSGIYGVWVKSSSEVTIQNNRIVRSLGAGIFVGCTATGIKNKLTCNRSRASAIDGNVITITRHLGIAIDRGNRHIHVFNNHVASSGKFDLFDSNPACGTDTWSSDIYSTHNQACVK